MPICLEDRRARLREHVPCDEGPQGRRRSIANNGSRSKFSPGREKLHSKAVSASLYLRVLAVSYDKRRTFQLLSTRTPCGTLTIRGTGPLPASKHDFGVRTEMKTRLRVMKFGGTSVGDAACIARTAQIIAKGAAEGRCVAVVSAMSGVTNRLIEAAKSAQTGNAKEAASLIDALQVQHESALEALLNDNAEKTAVCKKLGEVLAEGRRFCEGTALLRELTTQHWMRYRAWAKDY